MPAVQFARVRIAALAAVAAVSLLVSCMTFATISAEPPAQLTEIAGSLPSDGEIGLVVWGGGSLFQLQSRAATLGCQIQMIWLPEHHVGGHFDAPSFVNQRFLHSFASQIPSQTQVVLRCRAPSYTGWQQPSRDERFFGQDWAPWVSANVLPRLPVPDSLCIWRFDSPADAQQAFGEDTFVQAWAYYSSGNANAEVQPAVVMLRGQSVYVETHELCHAQQDWYRQLTRPRHVKLSAWQWDDTPAARAFVQTVPPLPDHNPDGMRWQWERNEHGQWSAWIEEPPWFTVDNDGQHIPAEPLRLWAIESAADVCAFYLGSWEEEYGAPNNLMDGALDWIQKHVIVLPSPAE